MALNLPGPGSSAPALPPALVKQEPSRQSPSPLSSTVRPCASIVILAVSGYISRRSQRSLRRKVSCRVGSAVEVEILPSDLYGLLGIERFQGTKGQLQAAYRRTVKYIHPDIVGSRGRDLLELVQLAYRTLTNPVHREIYDEELQAALEGGPVRAQSLWSSHGGSPPIGESRRPRSPWSDTAPIDARGIFVDEGRCVMCWCCMECAPATFAMDEDITGRAHVVLQYGDPLSDVEAAVDVCPTHAISFVSREDLPFLEDLVTECHLPCPVDVQSKILFGDGQVELPPSPLEILQDQKEKVKRLGNKAPLLNNMKELAAALAKAAAALPRDIRAKLWSTHPA